MWIKYSHREDSEPISTRNWIALDNQTPDRYSISTDTNDYIEYVFKIPVLYLQGSVNGTTGIAQYTNTAGITFNGFKQFKIKFSKTLIYKILAYCEISATPYSVYLPD